MKKLILLFISCFALIYFGICNSSTISFILSKSKSKSVIIKAEKRSIKEGQMLPYFKLRDLNNKIISDVDDKETTKVFLFWEDDNKPLPKELRKLNRPLSQMLKEYESLNSKKVKVYSCFLNDEESFKEVLPKHNQLKKTTFMIGCLDWAKNYLNLNLFKRVVIIKNNRVVLIKYINNNIEDFNFIKKVVLALK